jgi:hypothetical protein
VAFFLAGLVVLGGQQAWWLQPLLMGLSVDAVFYGATALTAITDNAALTYLASLVPGLSDEFKVAIVAGAVAGDGLTVIANAPNPAGVAILKGRFDEGVVNAGKLLVAAIPPTIVAVGAEGSRSDYRGRVFLRGHGAGPERGVSGPVGPPGPRDSRDRTGFCSGRPDAGNFDGRDVPGRAGRSAHAAGSLVEVRRMRGGIASAG